MKILRLAVWVSFLSTVSSALSAQSLSEFLLPPGALLPHSARPLLPQLPADAPAIRSGELQLVHSPNRLGCFLVSLADKSFATGQERPEVGYLQEGMLRWLDLASAADAKCIARIQNGSLSVAFSCREADGAAWNINQEFRPGARPGVIEVESRVSVNSDRAVAFLPMFMVFPGAGTFGTSKGQGLFAGLEYLEDEPSSSEADVLGPASKRQVPDALKITFPLMAIQKEDRYLALIWQMRPHFAALFDSPDRLFDSGGHAMGLVFPGSDGKNRVDGNVLPKAAELIRANQPLVLRAMLVGGRGKSVVPAVEQYTTLRGLPPKPANAPDFQQYALQAAGAWLHSRIREGVLIRHAVAQGGFKAQPAADAAVWMDWLAGGIQNTEVAGQLKETARQVLEAVPEAELNFASVGHIRYPVPALLFGSVAKNATRAEQAGKEVLGRFQPDGSIVYQPGPGGVDFGKTHFSREATGLTSAAVLELLQAAAFCGDPGLLAAGLKELRALGKFANGIPRGAQTWECPLHTPDILASAHMVHAYILGYELTGEKDFLDQARYWAWTGVPFVYLVNPTANPVGLYSTIAVFGATQWRAPVWLGLPVQWCGLVYADSLYHLSKFDPNGPWKRLAGGITLSGIQQSWPSDDKDFQGLLPDSFVLRDQHRNGPAINPATVQACAVQFFAQKPVYDFHCFLKSSVRVHAPGTIIAPVEAGQTISFGVEPWWARPYYVLINGLVRKPELWIDGERVECLPPHEFIGPAGRLILELKGKQEIKLAL